MENFALRLFTEDMQAVVDFLRQKANIYEEPVSIDDLPEESREEIKRLPVNRIGRFVIPEPNAVAYLRTDKNCWAYKIIATNDVLHVFYLTFLSTNGRLISVSEIKTFTKDWQVLLTRKYNKEYLDSVRRIRKARYDEMKAEYDAKLHKYREETDELINNLSVIAFPISERK